MSKSQELTPVLLALLVSPATLPAEDWPQWRGSKRDGVWRQDGLPEVLAESLPARWRRPIGGGYGGIAVAAGRVYVMDRQKMPEEVERVHCLDAATGKALWQHEYVAPYGKMDYDNGPRSTPTVHDGRVYTYGTAGHLHCLDALSGKVIWSRDTVRDFKGRVPTWGHACSPLIDGPRVIVQVGGEPEACIVALDRMSGGELWRALPDRPGYSSPVLIDTPTGRQLLCWTAEHITALEPTSGKLLWKSPHTTEYDVTISDPVHHAGMVLVSDYWEGSIALKVGGKPEKPDIAWQGKQLSLLMSTPLYHDGHVYALDRFRGLKCLELKTGVVKWENEHVTPRGRNPHASLIWLGKPGEKMLVFNASGELLVGRVSPKGYEQISKAAIINETWAHPAYADRCIFARNDNEIVCVPLVGK